jgi:hypothetical protein
MPVAHSASAKGGSLRRTVACPTLNLQSAGLFGPGGSAHLVVTIDERAGFVLYMADTDSERIIDTPAELVSWLDANEPLYADWTLAELELKKATFDDREKALATHPKDAVSDVKYPVTIVRRYQEAAGAAGKHDLAEVTDGEETWSVLAASLELQPSDRPRGKRHAGE